MNKVKIVREYGPVIYRDIPSEWEELTPEQVVFIAPRMLNFRPDIQAMKDEIMAKFMQIRNKDLRRLNIAQMNGLHKALNFLWEKNDLTTNPLPLLKIRFRKYHGPGPRMKDISFGQFMIADTFFLKYMRSRSPEDLNMFVASLYYRKEFDASKVERVAQKLRRAKMDKKLAVVLFFTGCRNYINNRFPLLFPKPAKGESKAKGNKASWGDVLISLVGENPAEKDRVEKLDLYFALAFLESQIRRSRELKEKYNLK